MLHRIDQTIESKEIQNSSEISFRDKSTFFFFFKAVMSKVPHETVAYGFTFDWKIEVTQNSYRLMLFLSQQHMWHVTTTTIQFSPKPSHERYLTWDTHITTHTHTHYFIYELIHTSTSCGSAHAHSIIMSLTCTVGHNQSYQKQTKFRH